MFDAAPEKFRQEIQDNLILFESLKALAARNQFGSATVALKGAGQVIHGPGGRLRLTAGSERNFCW